MREYRNAANGVCIVIGNGPSLRDVPWSFLFHYPTFGANRLPFCELNGMKFVPTYYVCVNPLVLAQNHEDIHALTCVKFLRGKPLKPLRGPIMFSKDMPEVHEGWNVTFVSLQIAFWMGFDTVLLVGVDHRYQFDGKPNEKQFMDGPDPNHFAATYFAGQDWNLPDLEKSEEAYRIARATYEEAGRRIYNIGPSALDVFERGEIEPWM